MKILLSNESPTPGLLIYAVSILIPLFWIFSLENDHKFMALLSQYFGVFALITMSYVQLLATRLPVLELIFGGLDRIYVIHKWLAISALAALLLHENIDPAIVSGTRPLIERIARQVGEFGYNGILLLSIITALTFIPYHWWKRTHSFIGLFFAMGVFHFIFIYKSFQSTDSIGFYVLFFCIIGIVSYVYTLFFRQRITGYRYKVSEIQPLDAVTEVKLVPVSKKLQAQPGQFAFIRFLKKGFNEIHPYTISNNVQENGEIRFSIKSLGGYTKNIASTITTETEAIITGPFGKFKLHQGSDPQIWVAAGIGITPFLSFANNPKLTESGLITLYYCVRGSNKIPYIDELTSISQRVENFKLILIDSTKAKRLTAEQIIAEHKATLSESIIYFCGPAKMRNQLFHKLFTAGLTRKNFKFEEFEIRTGIGIRRGFNWLLEQIRTEIESQPVSTKKQQDVP